LLLELAGLVHRRLERAEAVAAVDERDRVAGRVLQAERPVERRVAAADDHALLADEDALLTHDVVEPLALPFVDALDAELARLERAVARGDDERAAAEHVPLVGADREQLLAALLARFERAHLLAEPEVGIELEPLLGAEVDEGLALDLRVAGDVVDVLLGIRGRDLAADLLEALDDPHRRVAV